MLLHHNMDTEEIITRFCLWKEILSQHRIRHYKTLQRIGFAYKAGIISSYSNRINLHNKTKNILFHALTTTYTRNYEAPATLQMQRN